MAKQLTGILGVFKGKIAGVVGAQWKQTPYIRGYVIPANPNTVLQQAQRAKLTTVVWMARTILSSVIQKFFDPFQKSQSGYNRFSQINLKAMADSTDYDAMLMSEGSLESALPVAAWTYDTATGNTALTWTTAVLGNGDANDEVGIVIFDTTNKVVVVDDTSYTRSDGEGGPNIGAGRTLADIQAYMFFFTGTGSDMLISPSIWDEMTAA